MQVSDRLVTRDSAPLDFLSNKSLIIVAANGVVTLSYTGRAFLDAVPTDQWLAEVVRGKRFDRSRKPPAISFEQTLQVPDIGRNLERIRIAIQEIRLSAAIPTASIGKWYGELFEIGFVGWQWYRKKRLRPIVGSIEKAAWSLSATIRYLPRSPLQCRRIGFTAVPAGHVTRAELTSLYSQLGRLSEVDTESALVTQIRQISATTPIVGPDCMSVVMPRPGRAPIRVKYFPVHQSAADLVGVKWRARLPVAFSPWILAPAACHAPSMVNGNTSSCFGGIEISMSGPPSDIQVLSSQARPVDPTLPPAR